MTVSLANGQRLPQTGQHNTLTMAERMNACCKFAAGYYVKHGQPTDTIFRSKGRDWSPTLKTDDGMPREPVES